MHFVHSTRFRALVLALGLSLCACEVGGSALSAADPGGLADASLETFATLEEERGRQTIQVGLGGTHTLVVQLRDKADDSPISSATVTFALEGEPGGSSLRELSVTTDERGKASTLLSAGMAPGTFTVRATAPGAEPLRIEIVVDEAVVTALHVQLSYEGQRPVESREVLAFTRMSCDEVNAMASEEGDRMPLLHESWDGASEEITLDVDVNDGPLTLVGRARGPYDNTVAQGCTGIDPAQVDHRDEDADRVTIPLADASVRLEGSYEVVADLTVDASIHRVAQALMDSVEILLPEPTSSADRLLNAIEDVLQEDGFTEERNWVAAQRDFLAEGLQQTLDDNQRGLPAMLRLLAGEVLARGAQLEVEAELVAVGKGELELSYAPISVTARDQDSERPLTLSFGVDSDPGLDGGIGAGFNMARGVLVVDALHVELGLGTYGAELVQAMIEEHSLVTLLKDAAGCDEFEAWTQSASSESDPDDPLSERCDAACAAQACALAVDEAVAEGRAALEALNMAHSRIGLRGEVPVHDLDEDGVADHVEQTHMSGSWGRAPQETVADTVDATLQSIYTP